MRRTFLLALFPLVLAGCTTMTPQERRAADETVCRDYGFLPGTDAFAECLQRIDLSRAADRRYRALDDPFFRDPLVVYRPVLVR